MYLLMRKRKPHLGSTQVCRSGTALGAEVGGGKWTTMPACVTATTKPLLYVFCANDQFVVWLGVLDSFIPNNGHLNQQISSPDSWTILIHNSSEQIQEDNIWKGLLFWQCISRCKNYPSQNEPCYLRGNGPEDLDKPSSWLYFCKGFIVMARPAWIYWSLGKRISSEAPSWFRNPSLFGFKYFSKSHP